MGHMLFIITFLIEVSLQLETNCCQLTVVIVNTVTTVKIMIDFIIFISSSNSIAKFDFYFYLCPAAQLLLQVQVPYYNEFEYALHLPIYYCIFGVLI